MNILTSAHRTHLISRDAAYPAARFVHPPVNPIGENRELDRRPVGTALYAATRHAPSAQELGKHTHRAPTVPGLELRTLVPCPPFIECVE